MLRIHRLALSCLLVVTCAGWTAGARPVAAQTALDPQEAAALQALNVERTNRGLVALTISPTLQAAAEWMANDMATKGYVAHTEPSGRTFDQRIRAFGYTPDSAVAENLAAGQTTGVEVVNDWMNSPGHRTNNLNGEYVVAGMALVTRPGSTYGTYWALEFGSVNDSGTSSIPAATPTATATPSSTVVTPVAAATFAEVHRNGIGFVVPQSSTTAAGAVAGLAARGCSATGLWVTQNGRLVGYIVGAPAFVNAGFPAAIGASTIMLANCG